MDYKMYFLKIYIYTYISKLLGLKTNSKDTTDLICSHSIRCYVMHASIHAMEHKKETTNLINTVNFLLPG